MTTTAVPVGTEPTIFLTSAEQNDARKISPRETRRHMCSSSKFSSVDGRSLTRMSLIASENSTRDTSRLFLSSVPLCFVKSKSMLLQWLQKAAKEVGSNLNINKETQDSPPLTNQVIKTSAVLPPTSGALNTLLKAREKTESTRLVGNSNVALCNPVRFRVVLCVNPTLQSFSKQRSLSLQDFQSSAKDIAETEANFSIKSDWLHRLNSADDEHYLQASSSSSLEQLTINDNCRFDAPNICFPVRSEEQLFHLPVIGDLNCMEAVPLKACHRSYMAQLESNSPSNFASANSISPSALLCSQQPVSLECLTSSGVADSDLQTFTYQKGCKPGANPALISLKAEKRKESLERNKEAAWRYRKRKKEEQWLLEERAKILEDEKAKLLVGHYV